MSNEDLQVENGHFTRIVNPLIERLIQVPFKGCELAVAIFIIRKTYGYQKKQDEISLTQMEQALKRSRPTIVKALANLRLVNIAKLVKRGDSIKASNEWAINKYFDTWELVKLPQLVKTKRGTSKDGFTKTSKDGLTHKRKKETTKEIVAIATPYSFEEEIQKLKDSSRKDFKIIALYWVKKGWRFENREQFNSTLTRELKPAKALKGYSGIEIAKAIKHCQSNYTEWSLETVGKRITDLINKK